MATQATSEHRAIASALLAWIESQQVAPRDMVIVMTGTIAGTLGTAAETPEELYHAIGEIHEMLLAGAFDTFKNKQGETKC